MDTVKGVIEALRATDIHLFTIGKTDITLWTVLAIIVSVSVVFVAAGWSKGLVADRLLGKSRLDYGTRQAIGTITKYVVLVAGFMIVMQTVGINLTTFNVLAGALGVGIGFGLQDIVKNFISGLIIMFDRPIHIGDRIEIGGAQGEVTDIGARRITMVTPDGVTVVVPNGKLITETVRNLHGAGAAAPLTVTVNISRDSDPKAARELIEQVGRENPSVQQDPAPFAQLKMPTGAAFPFELRVWTPKKDRDRDELLNQLHYALVEKLAGAGVKLV